MGRSLFDRMMIFFGFEEERPVDEEEEARQQQEEEQEEDRIARLAGRQTANGHSKTLVGASQPQQRRGRLVSLPGGDTPGTVVIVHPRSFDEVQEITDRLKHRHPVIVNLEGTDQDAAQKIVNFLSGAVYALDGDMQRIGSGVLFFAPSNVSIERVLEAHRDTPASESGT